MIGRLLWFGAGAATAVYASSRLRRTADRFGPQGITDQLSAVGAGMRYLAGEVRAGMAERERELRASLGVDEATLRRMLSADVSAPRPREDVA